MDAFATNYPGCTDITHGIRISGADITDLSPLLNISSVAHDLTIINNPLLVNLNGLEGISVFYPPGTGAIDIRIENNTILADISALSNLTPDSEIESLYIKNNPSLISLNGLQGIGNSVTFYLEIINNDSLINLNGLNNIPNVYDELTIEGNNNLNNLTGLEGLQSIDNLNIINNESLTTFIGLQNINIGCGIDIRDNAILENIDVFNSFEDPCSVSEIKNNPSLSVCNIEALCLYMFNYRNYSYPVIEIENNAPGCNSVAEVAFHCGLEPFNDECEGATELTLGETVVAYNELATLSAQTPSCNDVNRLDVWFTVNSGSFTSLDIITEAGYSLQLWEGDCASLTQVASACAEGSLNDITVTTNTDYYVQVWSDSEARQSQRATGLFDILVQDGTLSSQEFAFEGFGLYPNPVKSELNFSATGSISSVVIYNLLGQEVLNAYPNAVQTSIDMADFKTGIYLVKVGIGNSVATYKVVKE